MEPKGSSMKHLLCVCVCVLLWRLVHMTQIRLNTSVSCAQEQHHMRNRDFLPSVLCQEAQCVWIFTSENTYRIVPNIRWCSFLGNTSEKMGWSYNGALGFDNRCKMSLIGTEATRCWQSLKSFLSVFSLLGRMQGDSKISLLC